MIVNLSNAEQRIVGLFAELREEGSRTLGCTDRFGAHDPTGDRNRMGCGGELAIAKLLGLPLRLSVNTFKAEPDFWFYGIPVEVRTSEREGTPLFFRTGDNEKAVFIHVRQTIPYRQYIVKGWAWGWGILENGELSGDPRRPRFPALKETQLRPILDLIQVATKY